MTPDPCATARAARSDAVGIVWFRNDLRLEDNPAWNAATSSHRRVTALYVVDPLIEATAGPLRRSRNAAEVRSLDRQLRTCGGCLLIRSGRPHDIVASEVERLDAAAVFLNRNPGPGSSRRDDIVRESLAPRVDLRSFWGNLVLGPGGVQTREDRVPRVFTSFWKRWRTVDWDAWPAGGEAEILDEPGDGPSALGGATTCGTTGFDPPGLKVGTDGAHELLHRFIDKVLQRYPEERDALSIDSTSDLSVALHFGTISPRLVVEAASGHGPAGEAFIRQIAWRDWYAHLLFENPRLAVESMRPEYEAIEWRDDPHGLKAWKEGRTGYPIVDAGMRQLIATGRMHNRARLIAASFLVKDLLIDWRDGERHFRRHLLDGDLSQNVGNWQWVAGVGPDAAPYFRIFNPIRQAEAHDPQGEYVRTWVPELRMLANRHIHTPWLAPPGDMAAAGVELGSDYPSPIVNHPEARERALAAYKAAKGQR